MSNGAGAIAGADVGNVEPATGDSNTGIQVFTEHAMLVDSTGRIEGWL